MQRAFGKGFYTDPNSPVSIYTLCKAFRQRCGVLKPNSGLSFLPGATAERVCASFQRGIKILVLCCGYLYKCVGNAHCTAVLFRSAPNREQSLSFLLDF